MIKKRWVVWLGSLLLVALLASGCAAQGAKNGDVVTVNYTLTLDDGTVYDTSTGSEPLKVTLGEHKVLAGFEEALIGMRVGDKKTVKLPPEKAYGPYRPELVKVYSKSQLPTSVPAEVGQQLQAMGADGKPYPVVITKVTGDQVTVDGNLPLAGKTLTFALELMTIGENAAPAPSSLINQTSLSWGVGGLVVLVSGSTIFYLWRRRRPRRVRGGPVRRSEGLLAEIARLDDDFKSAEETYHKVRDQKKVELVKAMERSEKANGHK